MTSNNSTCNLDEECPGTQWCYKYFEGEDSFCDCPSFYGLVGKDTGCKTWSLYTAIWAVPTFFFCAFAIVILVYNIKTSEIYRFWKLKIKSPALKIWVAIALVLIFMLISYAMRLWNIFDPESWNQLKPIRRQLFQEREVLKTSLFIELYFLFFMCYIICAVISIVETGVLWLELTYTAKKLKPMKRFGKVRMIALLIEGALTLVTVLSVALGEYASLALFGYLGIPFVLILMLLIALGRKYMLDLLTPKPLPETRRSVSSGRRLSTSTTASKFREIGEDVRDLSRVLLIALFIALVPCTIIFLGVQLDWRKTRPGEVGFFAFGFLMLDCIFIVASLQVLKFTSSSVKQQVRQRSSTRDSKGSIPSFVPRKKNTPNDKKTYEFDSNMESPEFNKWKKKLADGEEDTTYEFNSNLESPSFNEWKKDLNEKNAKEKEQPSMQEFSV